MNDDTDDDIPTALTKILRNVDGVHTVYATKGIVPTVVTAVVEAVRNDAVGMHLVTVTDGSSGREVVACVGVTGDEAAPTVCRRAHDAMLAYFVDRSEAVPATIAVKIGRVG